MIDQTKIPPQSTKSQPDVIDQHSVLHRLSLWYTIPFILLIIFLLPALIIIFSLHQPLSKQPLSTNPSTPRVIPTSSSSIDKATDWKTYTNIKYGYSLKYPTDQNLRQFTCGAKWGEVGGDETFVLNNSQLTPCELQEWFYPIQIDVIKGNTLNTHETETLLEKKTTKIDNFDSVYYHVPSPANDEVGYPDYIEIRTYLNDHTYIFTLGNTSYKQLFHQILSTFRFLDQETNQELWEPMCRPNGADDFDITVRQGEGLTHFARNAVDSYLLLLGLSRAGEVNHQPVNLTPEEKIYAEDYLGKQLSPTSLVLGSQVTVSCSLTEEAIIKARLLTLKQKGNLEKYSQQVYSFQINEWINQILEEAFQDSTIKPQIININ